MHLHIFDLNMCQKYYTVIDEDKNEVKWFDELSNSLSLYSIILLGYREKITRNDICGGNIVYFTNVDPNHYEFITATTIELYNKLDKLYERLSQGKLRQFVLLSFNHSIRNIINEAIQFNRDSKLKVIHDYLNYVIANSTSNKAIEICEKCKNYLAANLL